MGWLSRLLGPSSHPVPLPTPAESTREELEREKMLREHEHRRTETLARILNDYRAQDNALRR